MKRNTFNQHIAQASWRDLFITEMGWNRPQGQEALPTITIDETDYDFTVVAQRNGFQILSCIVANIPNMSTCRKIDLKLRRQANDYIAIYSIPQTEHHLWACPLKQNEKRDMVIVEYATAVQADFLFSKMDAITFDINDATTIIDVRQRVSQAFAVNSEKITHEFYKSFRKQHKDFASFITGINDNVPLYDNKKQELNRDKLWYASVMLNRLMFCYFIQKKGFLNGDVDYLNHKLQQVQEENGRDQFFTSFYRIFLISLFHDGLNAPHHTPEWEHRFGRIPYLNGGMFDLHTLEQKYDNIDIADEAFSSLFEFFDTWQWHLDTRITATGKDINPDVLGYIFEQYINDRSAMGAYYTKEDITEYISKNCILPWVFDHVAESSSRDSFRPNGEIWSKLKVSGDRYIYDAVKQGYATDWRDKIPEDIACGLDTSTPNLLERRKEWNRPTPKSFALPTEIWRETVERLQRCDTLIGKITSGEICHINDFITYNLDIRSFTYDLLAHTSDHKLVANFYHALQQVTILDPTCGSGAFLFAALGILEPLYEVCILRMQEWNEQNPHLFKKELEEITRKYRSNIQYFIYKSIILRNLYGVDIMVEATEIAKLRLFLKMVAVVDVDRHADNMGLDPLPDIDFNIRCGNTLVGYATERQLENDLTGGDIFAVQEFRDKIEERLKIVSAAYEIFRQVQLTGDDDRSEYVKAKQDLRAELANLNDLLSHHMFAARGGKDYNEYLSTHQPFHWLAEFYNIIHDNGGFDVVIGNPPYVEYTKKDPKTQKAVCDYYKIRGYVTESCGNLYAFVIERSKVLTKIHSKLGLIIPSASICTPRMDRLLKLISRNSFVWISVWDERPSKLFDGVDQQLSIHIISRKEIPNNVAYITPMTHWAKIQRDFIFKKISYQQYPIEKRYAEVIAKIGNMKELLLLSKIGKESIAITQLPKGTTYTPIYYKNAGGRYWKLIKSFPTFYSSQKSDKTSTEKELLIPQNWVPAIVTIITSSLFYWYWRVVSNCRHLTNRELENFPIKVGLFENIQIRMLFKEYEADLRKNKQRTSTNNKNSGNITQDFYYVKLSKPIIDEIDKVLAKHYGFTEEELDFIINYDIKYRMGDELNNN